MVAGSAARRPSDNGEPFVSVIVPVLDDSVALSSTLQSLQPDAAVEIIVVDGACETDAVMARLRAERQDVLWSAGVPGRGAQMNAGARLAHGRWLIFLHADTRLGEGWQDALRFLDDRGTHVGGSFAFRLATDVHWARLIECAVAWRVRVAELPYGDQALFVRRDVFAEIGGYRELPLMEDVEFVRRLRRRGLLAHLPAPAITSPRRWEQDGWFRRSVGNIVLLALYFAGVDPARLARRYGRGRRG